MKIIDNSKKPAPRVRFGDMPPGATFSLGFGGGAFIKTNDDGAVRLVDGVRFNLGLNHTIETVYPDAVLYLHGAPNE